MSKHKAQGASWRAGPATQKQMDYLDKLGVATDGSLTKGQASDLIEENKPQRDMVTCWECGSTVARSRAEWDGNGWYCGC